MQTTTSQFCSRSKSLVKRRKESRRKLTDLGRRAIVHPVDSLSIADTQAPPLPDNALVAMVQWNDCVGSVSRERFGVEVRHRVVIVAGVEVAELCGVDYLEVVGGIFQDVVESYLDEVIAVDVTVHVMVAQSMDELVHDDSALEAAVLAQGNALHAADSPEIAPTSSAVEDVNVIDLAGSVASLVESDASVVLDVVQGGSNGDFMKRIYKWAIRNSFHSRRKLTEMR